MSDVKMSDVKIPDSKSSDFKSDGHVTDGSIADAIACPPCPVCGATTVLTKNHKAVDVATNVFRCTACNVRYPVAKGTRAVA